MATKQQLENKTYLPTEWETVLCPVCGADKPTLYERYGNQWQYTYVLCGSCKLVYQSPRPKYDDSFAFDAYEFYASKSEAEFSKNPVQFYENEGAGYKSDLKDILKYDQKRSAFLDVGAYLGCLLYYTKPHYQSVYGVEISTQMAKLASEALNVSVFTDKYENLKTETRFSCITISHVLEHIPDPHSWLRKSREILDQDGVLIISVPNMFSLSRKIKLFFKRIGLRKGKWEGWRTPDHLFEPTVQSMKTLFQMNNFEIVDFYTYSRSSNFLDYLLNRKLYWGSNLRFIVKTK